MQSHTENEMPYRGVEVLVEQGLAPSLKAAYRLVAQGQIPGVIRFGRRILIDTERCQTGLSRTARPLRAADGGSPR